MNRLEKNLQLAYKVINCNTLHLKKTNKKHYFLEDGLFSSIIDIQDVEDNNNNNQYI